MYQQVGILPNIKGKVENGVFVSGWLKRGPSGVIATNIIDSIETVESIKNDIIENDIEFQEKLTNDEFIKFFDKKNINYVTFDEYKKLEKYEIDNGKKFGKIREKVTNLSKMIEISKK